MGGGVQGLKPKVQSQVIGLRPGGWGVVIGPFGTSFNSHSVGIQLPCGCYKVFLLGVKMKLDELMVYTLNQESSIPAKVGIFDKHQAPRIL